MDQSSARVAKNKAQSSCSFFKPLRGFAQLGECAPAFGVKPERLHRMAQGLAPTCLFLDLALSKPCANTQHSTAEATHGSRQVQMATNVLSHTGEDRWGDEVGGRLRTGSGKGSLVNALKSMPGGQLTGSYPPEKSHFLNKSLICSPASLRPCQSPGHAKTN